MTRTATVRTDVENPELVAAAVRPDNTAEMETRVEERDEPRSSNGSGDVVTRIERDDTSGLHSTVDDYVVNLRVAAQLTTNPTQSNHE